LRCVSIKFLKGISGFINAHSLVASSFWDESSDTFSSTPRRLKEGAVKGDDGEEGGGLQSGGKKPSWTPQHTEARASIGPTVLERRQQQERRKSSPPQNADREVRLTGTINSIMTGEEREPLPPPDSRLHERLPHSVPPSTGGISQQNS
jgi:hypothetical protein